MSKRLVSILLLVSLLFSIPSMAIENSQPELKFLLNDTAVSLENELYIDEKGQIMCPLREISESLDYEVVWNNDDKSVAISNETQIIKLKIDETDIDVNGQIIKLESKPIVKGSITFVPVEFFEDALDLIIGWNSKQQMLNIRETKTNGEDFFKYSTNIEKQNELDAYMKASEESQNFHGSVLVSKDGEILLNEGYGFADFEQNTTNKSQTKFAIGSVTKQFTAMAIMQLEEKGLLSTEDILSKYFPDFPNGDEITVHNLLTHTSGLANYTDLQEFFISDLNNREPIAVINLIKDLPLEFEPGEKFSYSNTNYVLLGMIVEKITDISLADYLQENIFEPLNMDNTDLYSSENNNYYDATPYTGFLEVMPIDDELVLTQAFGAGNIYSTVEDLYRWDRALKSEQIVKKETLDKIFTSYTPVADSTNYGYGWMIADTPIGKQIYHGGNTLGFTSNIARFPDEDIVVIVLANNGYYDLTSITNSLVSIVLDKDYEMPESLNEVEIDTTLYDKYVGKYELLDGLYAYITKVDDKLYAQVTGQSAFEIFPLSDNKFFAKIADVRIEFISDDEGNVTGFLFEQLGVELDCKRLEDIKEDVSLSLDPTIYDNYVGEYELAPDTIITITKEDDKIFAQLTGQDKFEIFPKSEMEYFYKIVEASITFVKDESGNVTGLILQQSGLDMPANKIN